MRILVLPPRGLEFAADSSWEWLVHGLEAAGHDVNGFGMGEGPYNAVVAMNHQPLASDVQTRFDIRASHTVLIALEPRVTAPRMYTSRVLRRYGHRFAASPLWAKRMGGQAFRWPQEISPQQATQAYYPFAASMINGDKRSAIRGSLYGLRRSIIRESEYCGLPLAVFGPGWDAPTRARLLSGVKASARALQGQAVPRLSEAFGDLTRHPAFWMGTVEDKQEAFAAAPISVVIENSADYVSEKLIDAVRGGTAPVYVGPPLSRFGLPDSLAIPAAATGADIVNTVRNLSPSRIDEVVSAGEAWLNSADAQSHEIRTVLLDLGETIGQQLRKADG